MKTKNKIIHGKINGNIEIIIGNHLATSHVRVNGKELHVNNIQINVGSDNPIPRILMDLNIYEGELLTQQDSAEITIKELKEAMEEAKD